MWVLFKDVNVYERRGGSPIYIANKGEHNNGNKINQGVNYNTISLFSKRAKIRKYIKYSITKKLTSKNGVKIPPLK